MKHLESIKAGIEEKISYNEIARKVFLTYPTNAFMGEEERQYCILNEISCFFKIPIMSIQVAGSAKTGHSFYKKTEFKVSFSDLDIAIIDTGFFHKYMELVFKITKEYKDNTLFPLKNGHSASNTYKKYITKGIFRPDLMPSCPERAEWSRFFGKLSDKHSDLFKSINAGVYLSQTFFEYKQSTAILNFNDNEVV